jgi:O-antigen/teichoic acid export membrane protein/glycosyltransferase involved in cell wall biosynthesis
MSKSLDRSLVTGIAWTGVARWTTQLLSWGATLVTVRVLTPNDYGVFGMAMVFIGLAQIVAESGLNAAIIQRPGITEEETAELGGVAVIVGVALALLGAAGAGIFASFYRDGAHVVRLILPALSALFILRSVQVVPRALLARELRFRELAIIEAVETLVLVTVTLGCAFLGWKYWALVAGTLLGAVAATVLSLRVRAHRLAIPSGLVRDPVRFGAQVVGSQLSGYVYGNADFAIVGRLLGTNALGYYTAAWTAASIPAERVGGLVARVTPAFFAAVQQDRALLRRYFERLSEALALVTLPASVGLALVADEFVPVLLGSQWTAAILPLRLLALYGASRSVLFLAQHVLLATGQSRAIITFSVSAAVVLPIAFVMGSASGTAGVAWAWVVGYPLFMLTTFTRLALRTMDLSWGAYARTIAPAAGATLAMSGVVLLARTMTPATWPIALGLVVHAAIGAGVYIAIVGLFLPDRVRAFLLVVRGAVATQMRPVAPMFSAGEPRSSHRLLLVTYHFPPSASVGALRWEKMVRLARARGWEFDVLTLDRSCVPLCDNQRLNDLPEGTRVYGVPVQRIWHERLAHNVWRCLRGSRAGAMGAARPSTSDVARRDTGGSVAAVEIRRIPRSLTELKRAYFAWIEYVETGRWARACARVAKGLSKRGVHRAIITSGPPHMAHVAGLTISRACRIPLIVDLRDPWALLQRIPEGVASPVWYRLARRHERRVFDHASLIVTTTDPFRRALMREYPAHASRMRTIANGYDDDPLPSPDGGRCFIATYAGSIYLDRDPGPLLHAAARVVRRLALDPADFCLQFVGRVDDVKGVSLGELARAAGVEPFVRVYPMQPRAQVLRMLAQSAMLVVLHQDSDLAIPAKVFEYMRFDAWLLALAEPQSAVALLLDGTGADIVAPGDSDAIARVLERRVKAFRAGRRASALTREPRFSRQWQADALLDAVESITNTVPESPARELCVAS